MIRIKNGEILDYKLPRTGTLKNGETVSNYNKLPRDVLLAEGWKELEDIKPEYNAEEGFLKVIGYTEKEDKVIKNYEFVPFTSLPITIDKKIDALLYEVRKLVRVDDLSDDELQKKINLFDEYEVNKKYIKDDKFVKDGVLYEVIQGHTSQSDWVPKDTKSLYRAIMPGDVIPEWVQPIGDTGKYVKGSRVIHKGLEYISIFDGVNVWEPGAYGWELVE